MVTIGDEVGKIVTLPIQEKILLNIAVHTYFPYQNQEDINFGLRLYSNISENISEEDILYDSKDDTKIGHRFPNRGYLSLFSKKGRKVCRIGIPFALSLQEIQNIKAISVYVTLFEKYTFESIFPVRFDKLQNGKAVLMEIRIDCSKKDKTYPVPICGIQISARKKGEYYYYILGNPFSSMEKDLDNVSKLEIASLSVLLSPELLLLKQEKDKGDQCIIKDIIPLEYTPISLNKILQTPQDAYEMCLIFKGDRAVEKLKG